MIRKVPLASHRDERGFAWFPVQDCPELEQKVPQNLHCAEIKPGAVRGGHYHLHHTEYALLTGAHISLVIEDSLGNREECFYVTSPDMLFVIPAGIRHWVKNTGNSTNYYFGFFVGKGDVETIRVPD